MSGPPVRPPKRGCSLCGEPKLPGRGKRYCATCAENAEWRRSRRRATRTIKQRTPCAMCGGRKEPGHGRRFCASCVVKRKRKSYCRDCPAVIEPPAKLCPDCKAAAVARRRAYDLKRHVAYRARHPRAPRKMTATDAESRRIRYREKMAAEGREVRKPTKSWRPGRGAYEQVDPSPLVPTLREYLAERVSPYLFADDIGVSSKAIYGLLEGRLETISVLTYDRIATAIGVHVEPVAA